MANEQIEPLHTVAEVAARLRISPRTCGRLIASGDLRAAQVGGQFRISESEIRRVLQPGKVRHVAHLDAVEVLMADVGTILAHAQGGDHRHVASVLAVAGQRIETARQYHERMALDAPAPRPMPLTVDGEDVPRLTAAELEAGAQLGAEHDAAEPGAPCDVIAALAAMPATEAEIKVAYEAGRAHQAASKAK